MCVVCTVLIAVRRLLCVACRLICVVCCVLFGVADVVDRVRARVRVVGVLLCGGCCLCVA